MSETWLQAARGGELFGAATVKEGRDRFDKGAPVATLFETAEAQAEQAARFKAQEYFPTPPWAVRAIMEMFPDRGRLRILEPAAGRGHIALTLRELGHLVATYDRYDYGVGFGQMDFTDPGDITSRGLRSALLDLVMTNPPFAQAVTFVEHGLEIAPDVLVLCRLGFISTAGRYLLFQKHLEAVYICTERVPMVLGRYDPQASTATEYAWFHFKRDADPLSHPSIIHIPPGARARLERPEDVRI